MKKLRLILLMFAGMVCTSTFAQADNCSGLIQEVGHYLNNATANKQMTSKVKNWEDITWIQQQMGKGTKNTVSKKTYFWNDYGLVTVNNSVVAQIGKMPAALAKVTIDGLPELNQAQRILGKPDSIKSKLFLRYSWVCPDTNSNLIVNTNEAGKVLGVAGMSCTNGVISASNSPNCVGFSSIKDFD